jgi:cysteine desulfuration protein SufE
MALPGRSSRRRRTIFWQVRDWLGEQSRQSPCGGSPNPTGRRSWKGDPNSKDLPLTSVDAIRSDFAFLDDWEDRYRYVLELGRTLEPLSEAAHNGANKVRGCVSQVWLELGDGANAAGERVLHYRGDSDSHLVRGLIAIALALYSDRTVREILSSDAQAFFRELGLEQHLTPQRSNGVRAMIERIRADAAA